MQYGTMQVTSGDYSATIDLSAIDLLSVKQWRGLLKMAAYQEINSALDYLQEIQYMINLAWEKETRKTAKNKLLADLKRITKKINIAREVLS